MKISMVKMNSGLLAPATEGDADRMTRFKNGATFEIEIKEIRNAAFHRKVFKFMSFCFNFHISQFYEVLDEAEQFEIFRKDMTILAGYYHQYTSISGEVRLEAKSINYASMSQEEFERYFSALKRVADQKIFLGCTDENIRNELLSF